MESTATQVPKLRHKLTEVHAETSTAICSVCGPTAIWYRVGRASECRTVRDANRGARGSADTERAKLTRKAYRNRPDVKARAREKSTLASRQKRYGWDIGFTDESHARMVAEQEGRCAICGRTDEGKALAIDHDHVTGSIRGLLCGSCNMTLGRFKDDPARFRAAADYLDRSI